MLLWIYRKINHYLGDNYSLITVTAKISQEMKDKINNIYGWKQGNKIINI